MFNLGVFCSGTGSNLKAIFNSIGCNVLNARLSIVIINNKDAPCIEYCKNNNINYEVILWDKTSQSREDYYETIQEFLQGYNLNLIVLAGWMNIISDNFIKYNKNIINLHPALPNSYVGDDCIKQAYDDFLLGKIKYSGVMVHKVTSNLDRGHVYNFVKVHINSNDSYIDFENNIKCNEKGILISTINDFIKLHNENVIKNSAKDKYIGKVRCVENIDYDLLLMTASNRISAFDKHLTNIDSKGIILNKLSEFWFDKTKHIIDNHHIFSDGPYSVVRKTTPIKLEIVVRAYMTGSSETSIWTKYKNGERNIYGYDFKDNYRKNEILDNIIITPTTKGVKDVPITKEEIIEQNYLTKEEIDFIYEKAYELFKFGQEYASKHNLILVDTKYEFGKYNDKIILIDELHTCDSSRYWVKDSYQTNFDNNKEPVKLDKDAIRDWVKSNCDPYNQDIPEIPEEVKSIVHNVYVSFYEKLTETKFNNERIMDKEVFLDYYFKNIHRDLVVIFGGSVKDDAHLNAIKDKLRAQNIYSEIFVCSAHKSTKKLLSILERFENYDNRNIMYVTCAGMSNALSGVVACNSKRPVFACPPFSDKVDMTININSTLQMPSNVPTMTVLSPTNLALCIRKIYDMI